MVGYVGQNGKSAWYSPEDIGQDDGQSEVTITEEERELQYPRLPETRTDLGYGWVPIPVADALDAFRKFLERNEAKVFMMDVYASNNQVYRNIVIQVPSDGKGIFMPETISIQFNREEGRQFSLTCGIEDWP